MRNIIWILTSFQAVGFVYLYMYDALILYQPSHSWQALFCEIQEEMLVSYFAVSIVCVAIKLLIMTLFQLESVTFGAGLMVKAECDQHGIHHWPVSATIFIAAHLSYIIKSLFYSHEL